DCADRQPTLVDTQPVQDLVGDTAHRLQDTLVVGHGLAHAHEDDVADPAGASGDLAACQVTSAGDHLVDDFAGGQVPGQPGLAGGAERAVHTAAGLGGDAQGDPEPVRSEEHTSELQSRFDLV